MYNFNFCHFCQLLLYHDPLPGNGVELKSVHVHFAYGRIALTFKLLGQFGRFLDEVDHYNPPNLLIPFPGSLGSKSKVDCTVISKVWITGMLVAAEGQPDKRAGAPYLMKGHMYSQLATQSLGPPYLTDEIL